MAERSKARRSGRRHLRMARKRQAMLALQDRWMRQRDAERDRQCHTAQHPDVRPEEVLDKVTERIASRLKEELRVELQRETEEISRRKEDDERRLERFLATEIENHTCPICYDLMTPPHHAPTLLFPCGHTFCATCLAHQRSKCTGRYTCPYCRAEIVSQALNVSLQQLIQSFLARRAALDRSLPDSEEQETERVEEGQDFVAKFRTAALRCRLLENEKNDTQEGLAHLEEDYTTRKEELDTLREREQDLVKELDLVRSTIENCEGLVATLTNEKRQTKARLELIEATLRSVQSEKEKARLLAENYGFSVSDSDPPS